MNVLFSVLISLRYIKLSVLLVALCSFGTAHSYERTQQIKLQKGWNSVFLEVDPQIDNQNLSAFINDSGSTPIEVIATYYEPLSSIEYINSPEEQEWKKPTWNKWIRGDLPDSFLTNLYDLDAGRGYLVKSSKDYVWNVTGQVKQLRNRWQPNSFNLTGFQVTESGPSFHQLLSDNNSAIPLITGSIYKLVNGFWERVSLPDVEVDAGEAYWVFSNGLAEYQGGIRVDISSGKDIIDFSDLVHRQALKLTNTSNQTLTATLALVDNEIPLSLQEEKEGDGETEESYQLIYTPVTDNVTTLNIDPGDYEEVVLSVRRAEMVGSGTKTGLLKIIIPETYEEYLLPLSAKGVGEE